VRSEHYQTCARRSQPVGPLQMHPMCEYEDVDRISLREEECLDCKTKNRSEDKRRAVMEWLQGVDEGGEEDYGSGGSGGNCSLL
jgi:hypothetical protein